MTATNLKSLQHESPVDALVGSVLASVLAEVDVGLMACDVAGETILFRPLGADRSQLALERSTLDTLAGRHVFVPGFVPGDGVAPAGADAHPLRRVLRGECVCGEEWTVDFEGERRRRVRVDGRMLQARDGQAIGAVVVLHDAAESAPAAREGDFEAIFRSQPSAIVCTDPSGRIAEMNPAADSLLGYAPNELVGMDLRVLDPPDAGHDGMIAAFRDRAGTPLHDCERELRRKDGTVVACEVSGTELRAAGAPIGYVWTLHDVSQRRRVERSLAEMQRRLASSREEERLRVARELHDSSVQDLVGIGFRLAGLRRSLTVEAPSHAAMVAALHDLQHEVTGVVKQLRGVISDLRPAGLGEFGFENALAGYIAKLERGREAGMPDVRLTVHADVDALPQPLVLCLFRAAQEAVVNAVKHASASCVEVRVDLLDSRVVLRVEDDGQGFEVPTDITDLVRDDHFGLAGIGERVELMAGDTSIDSRPGRGTTLTVSLPLKAPDPAVGTDA